MTLTTFGVACRRHRIRMKAVIADQAAATGFSAAVISAVELGEEDVPEGYLGKLSDWMQLDEDESIELALLATKTKTRPPKRPATSTVPDSNGLIPILRDKPRGQTT